MPGCSSTRKDRLPDDTPDLVKLKGDPTLLANLPPEIAGALAGARTGEFRLGKDPQGRFYVILLESTAHYAPHLYDTLNSGLRNPIALVMEIFLAFLVIFHGVNGYRIAYFDLMRTDKWSHPAGLQSIRTTWIISILLW